MDKKVLDHFVLLYFRGLYLVIRWYGSSFDEKAEQARLWDFLFHSHQCPTNILHRIEDVFDPEWGQDPHGVMRYVANIPFSAEIKKQLDSNVVSIAELFNMFGTDGTPPKSEWPEKDGGLIPVLARMREQAQKDKAPKA